MSTMKLMFAPLGVVALGCGVLFAPVAHADPWDQYQCQNLTANIQNYARQGKDVTSLQRLYAEQCAESSMSPNTGGSPGAPNNPAPAPGSPNGGVGPGVAPGAPNQTCVAGGPCSSKGSR
jgi:hypothetical protein